MIADPRTRLATGAHHGNERWIIIHSLEPILDHRRDDLLAHCFGPFDSYDEAEAFELSKPDNCFAFAIPLVGPDLDDIMRSRHQ